MNIDELLTQARQDRGNSVKLRRVDLVKATGEYKKLGGVDDYRSSLLAIVDAHGKNGVMYSLVREVLHETDKLNAAVKDLVDAKEITKGDGKREFLLTTTKKVADQPEEAQSSDPESEGEDDARSDDEPPAVAQVKGKKPTGK